MHSVTGGGGSALTLKVIGLGAVVVEGRYCAHPDFVFSAGVVRIIITTIGVGIATGNENVTELITTLHDAAADHKRRVIS